MAKLQRNLQAKSSSEFCGTDNNYQGWKNV